MVDKSIPRLIVKNQHKEALEVLRKYNPQATLDVNEELAQLNKEKDQKGEHKNYNVCDIFRHKILLKTAFVTLSMW